MAHRLFHFSDDDSIARFEPRAVQEPSARECGSEWLNGPLVWAIDAWHQPLYLFPRNCPRILMWRTPATVPDDAVTFFGDVTSRMMAYVEHRWMERLRTACVYRYELPIDSFQSLDDAGMWVSTEGVTPLAVKRIDHLPDALKAADVELVSLETLKPLRSSWETSVHVSGIRLRHAQGWLD